MRWTAEYVAKECSFLNNIAFVSGCKSKGNEGSAREEGVGDIFQGFGNAWLSFGLVIAVLDWP